MKIQISKKMSEKDIERLDKLLSDLGEDCPPLDYIDGMFSALICSPVVRPLNEYMGEVLGDEDEFFGSTNNPEEIIGLLLSHYNSINRSLRNSLKGSDHIPVPFFYIDEDEVVDGELWAQGFLTGVSLQEEEWAPLIKDKEFSGCLLPMIAIAGQNVEQAKLHLPHIPKDEMKETIGIMLAGLNIIYRYFSENRIASKGSLWVEGEILR